MSRMNTKLGTGGGCGVAATAGDPCIYPFIQQSNHPVLRVGAFEPRSLVNGPGARAVLWVQGCGRRCAGCFNPEFLPREGGRLVAAGEVVRWVRDAAREVEAVGVGKLTAEIRNPKAEIRNPKEGRDPKAEIRRLKAEGRKPKVEMGLFSAAGESEPQRAAGAAGTGRSADFQSAVSRIFNPPTPETAHGLPTESRRYSRLKVCATTEGDRAVETSALNRQPSSALEGITFSGGEPFEQAGELALVAGAARQMGLGVLVFTGYLWEELEASQDAGHRALLAVCDLVVAGPYEREHPGTHALLASANQRLVFLSDRYRAHDFGQKRRVEFRIATDGTVRTTGFPSVHHPPIHHPSSIIHHPSSTIHHPSSIIHHPSSIIHHPPSIIHHPSSIIHHPPVPLPFCLCPGLKTNL